MERRRAARLQRSFWVWFRDAQGAGAWQVSPMRDFTARGVRFVAEQAFEAGTRLEMKLMLPMAAQPLRLTGRVAWARPLEGVRLHLTEHGVVFDAREAVALHAALAGATPSGPSASPASSRTDRRRSPRIRHPFYARYRLVERLGAAWCTVNPLDLNIHGMQFLNPQPLARGATLEVELMAPKMARPFLLRGRVVWSQAHASGVVEVGVEFLRLTAEQTQHVRTALRSLEAARKPSGAR